MATSSTKVTDVPRLTSFDVVATADADTGITFAHELQAVPVVTTGLQGAGATGTAARLSRWSLVSVDAINVVLSKRTAVGSGTPLAQCRVNCLLIPQPSYPLLG